MPVQRTVGTALCVLSLVSTAACANEDCKYSADRSAKLDVTGVERIEIVARGGKLSVRPGAASSIQARGKACASSEEYLAQTQLQARREGSVARIFVQVPDEMYGIGMHYATLDLTVEVPASLPVEITDTSGDMTVENVQVTKITDSSGNIYVAGAKDVNVRQDSSGDIRIERISGSVRIDNDSSGSIAIAGVGHDVEIVADSSGMVDVDDVKVTVRSP
jgi:hypothetical protein